jgi:iron complex outermembrane receptor protein
MNRFVNVLSGQEFRDYVKANVKGSSRALLDTNSTTNTDWQKEIYRLALTSDNNLSLSGTLTTKWINLPYRVSGGYLTQQSVLKTGKMDRYSAGLNVSPAFFDNKLKIDLNFKGSLSQNQFADQGAIGAAIGYDPTKPVRSGNENAYGGYYEWVDSKGDLIAQSPRNPLALLNLRDDRSEVTRYLGNAQIDYRFHFLPDLRINVNTGFDAGEGRGTNFIDPRSAGVFIRGGVNNQYRERKFQYLNETYLNYTKEISSIKSRIDITAGHSFQNFKTYQYAFPDVNVTKDSIVTPAGRLPSPPINVIESYFGRLNYSFNSKYLLTATIRRDGSSRFAPDYRWGLFPSAAFAWKINEESFLKSVKAISNLKVRVGYGVTGQQDVNTDYGYFGGYQLSGPTGNYQFGDTSFYRYYRPKAYQGDLRWEQTASYNAGIDFGIFDERITGAIDVFYRKTSDLLNFTNVPVGSNFTNAIIANVGDMTSKGIELTLNATIIKKQDFTWDASFNVTHFQNKITKLTIDNDTSYQGAPVGGIAGATGNTIQINSIGYSPQSFYVYEQVYRDGKPVFNEYVDQNGDGQITDVDKIRFKSPVPKAIFGFSSSATYKKLTFGIVMRASVGSYMYNNVASDRGHQAAIAPGFPYLSNASTDILFTNFSKNQAFSSYYVQNVSFLRCDNINIGYSLGDLIHPKLNVNINANIQNAFLVTKYKGIEPEISGGIDNNFFARPRVFVLGLTVGFNK